MGIVKSYFKAAGKSLEACKAMDARLDATSQAWGSFMTKHGAENGHTSSGQLVALRLGRREPKRLGMHYPEGWKAAPSSWRMGMEAAVPDKKQSIGKEIAAEMKALPAREGWGQFQRDIGVGEHGAPLIGNGNWFTPAIYEPVGEDFVIEVRHHEGQDPQVPADAIPLKMSEVWALREAAGVKVRA